MLNAATLPPQRGSVITGREFAQKIRTVNYLPDSIIVALWIWPIHPARVTDHHPMMLLIRTRTDVGVPRRLTLSRGDRLAAQPNTQPNPADNHRTSDEPPDEMQREADEQQGADAVQFPVKDRSVEAPVNDAPTRQARGQ
jgi:hypothetical protein